MLIPQEKQQFTFFGLFGMDIPSPCSSHKPRLPVFLAPILGLFSAMVCLFSCWYLIKNSESEALLPSACPPAADNASRANLENCGYFSIFLVSHLWVIKEAVRVLHVKAFCLFSAVFLSRLELLYNCCVQDNQVILNALLSYVGFTIKPITVNQHVCVIIPHVENSLRKPLFVCLWFQKSHVITDLTLFDQPSCVYVDFVCTHI